MDPTDIVNTLCVVGQTTVQLAATFAPVPWLAPTVTVVCGIIQLCQNVTTNRTLIFQLRDRCQLFLIVLHDNWKGAPPDNLIAALKVANNTLEAIRNKLDNWAKLSRTRAFLMQKEISDEIRRCHVDISDCLAKLEVISHIGIHRWQDEFEANRRRDHAEMIEYLSEIQNSQSITQGVLIETSVKINEMMAFMQNYLGVTDRGDRSHNGLQNNLYQLTLESGQLLPDFNLKRGEVQRIGQFPVSGSAAMDIWEGLFLQREKVAIKVIRAVNSDVRSLRRFMREVKIWGEIWNIDRGAHVLPFYGFSQNDGPYPYMVSPWQRNGNAISFVKKNDKEVNYKELIRGIAKGLRVLHTLNPPVIHGDLKGANIVINNSGKPLLADFGLSQIVEDITGVPFTQSRGVSESYRWFAPEVCVGQGVLSLNSDIYAFAMTALELITHQQPYCHIKHTTEVVIRSSRGENPRCPDDRPVIERGFDDKLWNLLIKCWALEPSSRPNICDVLLLY